MDPETEFSQLLTLDEEELAKIGVEVSHGLIEDQRMDAERKLFFAELRCQNVSLPPGEKRC